MLTTEPLKENVGFDVMEAAAFTMYGLLNEGADIIIADMRSRTVTASLERRVLNFGHTTLWRLAVWNDI